MSFGSLEFSGQTDFDADLDLPIWAGVVPLRLEAGAPERDAQVEPTVDLPSYVSGYRR